MCFEYENFGGEYHCWLQMDTSLIYGQFVPMTLLVIITLAIVEAAGDSKNYSKLDEANAEQRKTAKIMQGTIIFILPTVSNCE